MQKTPENGHNFEKKCPNNVKLTIIELGQGFGLRNKCLTFESYLSSIFLVILPTNIQKVALSHLYLTISNFSYWLICKTCLSSLLLLVVQALQHIQWPSAPAKRQAMFNLSEKPSVKKLLAQTMMDVLLMPYG